MAETVIQIHQRARHDVAFLLDAYRPPAGVLDVVGLARYVGLPVFTARLDEDVLAMLIGSTEGPAVYVPASMPLVRQRFFVAFELGRHLNDRLPLPDDCSYIERRSNTDSPNSGDIYAATFAAELLVSDDDVRLVHGGAVNVIALASRLQVPSDVVRQRVDLHTASHT